MSQAEKGQGSHHTRLDPDIARTVDFIVSRRWDEIDLEDAKREFKELAHIANKRVKKEPKACYCGDCLRSLADAANDRLEYILTYDPTINFEKVVEYRQKYRYFVIKNGIHSTIVQGYDAFVQKQKKTSPSGDMPSSYGSVI